MTTAESKLKIETEEATLLEQMVGARTSGHIDELHGLKELLQKMGVIKNNVTADEIWDSLNAVGERDRAVDLTDPTGTQLIEAATDVDAQNVFTARLAPLAAKEGHDEIYEKDYFKLVQNEDSIPTTPVLPCVVTDPEEELVHVTEQRPAVLIARGGEEVQIDDCHVIDLAMELLEVESSNTPRIDVPFDAAIVKEAAQLLNGVIGHGKKRVCAQHLSALSAVYDFLLVKPASRPAVLNEYGLLIEPTGAMNRDGIGRAVNFEAFNSQLQHFFEITCEWDGSITNQVGTDQAPFVFKGKDGQIYRREDITEALMNAMRAKTKAQLISTAESDASEKTGFMTKLFNAVRFSWSDGQQEKKSTIDDMWSQRFHRCSNAVAIFDVRSVNEEVSYPHSANRENIESIQNQHLQSLMRQGGVVHHSDSIYDESRAVIKATLENVLGDAVTYTDHEHENTVTSTHVLRALQCRGSCVWGCGHPDVPAGLLSSSIYKVLKQIHPDLSIAPLALAVTNDYLVAVISRVLEIATRINMSARRNANLSQDADGISDHALSRHTKLVKRVVPATSADNQPVVVTMFEDLDASDASVDASASETTDAPVIRAKVCLTSHDIETAVFGALNGELAKHAIAEGAKAVEKFTRRAALIGMRQPMARKAGLQFCVESTAAIASRAQHGAILSVNASVYLTALTEYMVAELLELSGNCAVFDRVWHITPHHIQLSMRKDKELNQFCGNSIIREGGVVPNIHPQLLPKESETYPAETFEKVFVSMIKTAPNGYLVDPRDGLHKCVVPVGFKGLSNDDGKEGHRLRGLPELDAACAHDATWRQKIAIEALNNDQRRVFEECQQNICVCKAFRCAQTRDSQLRTSLQLTNKPGFAALVQQIGYTFKTDAVFTDEAVVALQVYIEAYMVRLYEEANLIAINAKRTAVQLKDIRLARRLLS